MSGADELLNAAQEMASRNGVSWVELDKDTQSIFLEAAALRTERTPKVGR